MDTHDPRSFFGAGRGCNIVQTARRTAPAVAAHLSEDEGGTKSKGSQRPKKQRVAQGRAKAKQARRQRKKNR